jgi:hypothetical protein
MKWVKERDLFIAQTMAFVQSVTGKKPEVEIQAREARIEFVPINEVEKVERPVEVVRVASASAVSRSDFLEEIHGRVAAFRAHQQRFHRERDEYFNSVLKKARASTDREPSAPDMQ